VAAARASSLRDRAIDRGTVAVGEVGLLGELRPVAGLERRLREAGRLGFRRAVVPRGGRAAAIDVPGLEVVAVGSVREALEVLLAPAPSADESRSGRA
jgi:DNA repair protein RadA/Sms